MQISSRFTIAVHMLAYISMYGEKEKVTSEILSGSIQVNPVIIRRLLSRMKTAGLITVARGSGGALLAKKEGEITFLDICRAVDAVHADGLFHFHEHPNPRCPVGLSIHQALDGKLAQVQQAMEKEMGMISLADVVHGMQIKQACKKWSDNRHSSFLDRNIHT